MIKSVASVFDTVLGTDISGALNNFQTSLDSRLDDIMSKDRIKLDRVELNKLERFNYGKAWDYGHNLGVKAETNLKNMLGELTGTANIDNLLNQGQITDPLSQIADNTKGIDDKLNKVDWENNNLDSLKGLMETRAINDLSKEIKLEIHNEFTGGISSDIDVNKLTKDVSDSIYNDFKLAINGGV